MRELKYKLKDTTLTSDVNQTLSNLLSQTNKVKAKVVVVEKTANTALSTANNPSLALENLTDVVITAVVNGQSIVWNGKDWVNSTIGGAAFSTSGQGGFLSAGLSIQLALVLPATTGDIETTATNQVLVWQFILGETYTISFISALVSTGVAAQTVNFGIYSVAGNKLIDSGGLSAATSNAIISTAITPVTLTPGVYYFAASASSGSVQVECFTSNVGPARVVLAQSTPARIAYAANPVVSGVMPATLGALTTQISNLGNLPAVFFGV